METEVPTEVEILDGFIDLNEEGLKVFLKNNGLAMTLGDLAHVQGYFKNTEKRNPTITEIKVLDTYWSDHCRHTTFMTEIEDVKIESGKYTDIIKEAIKSRYSRGGRYRFYMNTCFFIYYLLVE